MHSQQESKRDIKKSIGYQYALKSKLLFDRINDGGIISIRTVQDLHNSLINI